MNIVNRVKNILVTPKTEWVAIEAEQSTNTTILTSYLLLLALIPAVCQFVGQGLIGYNVLGMHFGGTISWGIRQAVVSFISMIGGAYLTAFIINLLADSFGSVKNFDRAFALVAYSYTPMCLAGIFYIIPSLGIIATLAGLYGLYILYTGLVPMMKTPEDKATVYFIISLVCVIVVSAILGFVLGAILLVGSVTGL